MIKNLGWIGCKLVPFIQTASVLIESMSLILIALDRFLAVRNKSHTKLLQNKFFCLAVIFGVWTLGAGISSPVLFSYEYIDALVIPDDDESDEEPTKAFVCVTDMVSLCERTTEQTAENNMNSCDNFILASGRVCNLLYHRVYFHFHSGVCRFYLA